VVPLLGATRGADLDGQLVGVKVLEHHDGGDDDEEDGTDKSGDDGDDTDNCGGDDSGVDCW
jgi:hypothetical protein